MCCCFQLGWLNDHLFGKEVFIWFTVRVFRECLSVCVCASFPFGFKGGMWDLIVLVPGHAYLCTFAIKVATLLAFRK